MKSLYGLNQLLLVTEDSLSTGSCQDSNLEHLHGAAEAPWSTEPDMHSRKQPQDHKQTDSVVNRKCVENPLKRFIGQSNVNV